MSSAEGLVGREAELSLAAAAVRQLSGGRASALAIEGEAGMGASGMVTTLPPPGQLAYLSFEPCEVASTAAGGKPAFGMPFQPLSRNRLTAQTLPGRA